MATERAHLLQEVQQPVAGLGDDACGRSYCLLRHKIGVRSRTYSQRQDLDIMLKPALLEDVTLPVEGSDPSTSLHAQG